MREIVHLQLGLKSNFVGSHYWNALAKYYDTNTEQFDSSITYRINEFQNQLTYTPRLLICDLKGRLGTMNPNELHEKHPDIIHWDGKTERIEQQKHPKNNFLNSIDGSNNDLHTDHLTENVKVWSDFNSQYYHPNTIKELPNSSHETESTFQYFNQGKTAAKNQGWTTEFVDEDIRKLMEETDSAQGFQIMTDSDDAFSGLTAELMEILNEEFSKKSFIMFGVSESSLNNRILNHRIRELNNILLLDSVKEYDCLYVPVYLPCENDLNYDVLDGRFDVMYQSSAFLSSAIESITVPFRLKTGIEHRNIFDLQSLMNDSKFGSVATLSTGFVPVKTNVKFEFDVGSDGIIDWMRNLSLETDANVQGDKSYVVLRGLQESFSHQTVAGSFLNVKEKVLSLGQNHLLEFPLGVIIDKSYPQFFKKNINRYGLIDMNSNDGQVESISSMTLLSSGGTSKKLFERMLGKLTFKSDDLLVLSDFEQGQEGIIKYEWDEIRERFVSLTSDD